MRKNIEYYQPDQIWESVWNIMSIEQFYSEIFIPGIFKETVPEAIVMEYKRVEYLLCHSYFYYPLIDEAISKSTRIFEQSINLRLEELKIPFKEYTKLSDKIKKLNNYTTEHLINQWDRIRKFRNTLIHSKENTLYGIIFLDFFYQIVNIINSVFEDKSSITDSQAKLGRLSGKLKDFENGVFCLERGDFKILIHSVRLVASSLQSDKYLFELKPIAKNLNKKDFLRDMPRPINLEVSDLTIKEDFFLAREQDQAIKVIKVHEKLHLDAAKKYKRDLKKIGESNIKKYELISQNQLNKNITKFMYRHNWKK